MSVCSSKGTFLKHHPRGSATPEPDFLDYDNSYDAEAHVGAQRQQERKTRQFCRQVQRALNLILAGDPFVDEVLPAPDCGRLLVYVVLSDAAAFTELTARTPALRAEVASAIHRKRAPELCFVPCLQHEEEVSDAG